MATIRLLYLDNSYFIMTDKQDVEKTINLRSKLIGSKDDIMYITDDFLLLGSSKIKISEIQNIQRSKESDNFDIIYTSIIITNIISSTVLALTLTTNIIYVTLMSLMGLLIGYMIANKLQTKPAMYLTIETENSQYEFGVSTLLDAGNLFATINEQTDIELTYNNFVVSNDN